MRFLWKSQLKQERGKLLPRKTSGKSNVPRKERFASHTEQKGTYVLLAFLWLFFLATIGYLGLFSSYLTLTSWRVTGLDLISETVFHESVDQELAQQYFGFVPRNRFFLLRPGNLEHVLQKRYPLIQNVTIKRVFPDTFEISIEERKALVLWCVGDTCAHILEDGTVVPITEVYQREENQSRTLIIRDENSQPLKFGAGVFDDSFAALVVTLKQEISERFGVATKNTLVFSSRFANELRVQTETGWWVYVSTRIPLKTSLDALQLFLENEISEERLNSIDYIDLRTENRIFYRYRDGSGPVENIPTTEEGVKVENKGVKEKKKEE